MKNEKNYVGFLQVHETKYYHKDEVILIWNFPLFQVANQVSTSVKIAQKFDFVFWQIAILFFIFVLELKIWKYFVSNHCFLHENEKYISMFLVFRWFSAPLPNYNNIFNHFLPLLKKDSSLGKCFVLVCIPSAFHKTFQSLTHQVAIS